MHSKAVRLSNKEWLDRRSEIKQHAQNPSKEVVGLQSSFCAWWIDGFTVTQRYHDETWSQPLVYISEFMVYESIGRL